jgi:hypothetical protein
LAVELVQHVHDKHSTTALNDSAHRCLVDHIRTVNPNDHHALLKASEVGWRIGFDLFDAKSLTGQDQAAKAKVPANVLNDGTAACRVVAADIAPIVVAIVAGSETLQWQVVAVPPRIPTVTLVAIVSVIVVVVPVLTVPVVVATIVSVTVTAGMAVRVTVVMAVGLATAMTIVVGTVALAAVTVVAVVGAAGVSIAVVAAVPSI